MTLTPSIEVALRALADEEQWLSDSPERCSACGHRECFHSHDGDDGLFCLVDGCSCCNRSIDDPSEQSVPGTHEETVFGTGVTSASTKPLLTILSLGDRMPEPPGMSIEIVFAEETDPTMIVRRLESENEALQKDLAQAQEDHRSAERARQESLDDVAALERRKSEQLLCPLDGRWPGVVDANASCLPQLAPVPRGHCDRCDRCGWPLVELPQYGCLLGNCDERPLKPRRSHCACGAPYEDPS